MAPVIVGLLITFQSPVKIALTPPLILALFLPALVFEAAFHIKVSQLGRGIPTILTLAVPGVILTTLIVAGVVGLRTPLDSSVALVFGALISATDPMAVVALFRTLGVPKHLALLMESESLLDDGTAIVVFNLVIVIALTSQFDRVGSAGFDPARRRGNYHARRHPLLGWRRGDCPV